MQIERIAVLGLAVLIIGALSFFILSQENPETGKTYLDEIVENVFGQSSSLTVEEGDCVDVHYLLRYASNDTFIENNSETDPLQIYVSFDDSSSPEGYDTYSSELIEGFLESLVGLKEGEETSFTLSPEEAYGYGPEIGDEIVFSYPGSDDQIIEIIDIQETAAMPDEFISSFGDVPTTLLSLRTKVEEGQKTTMYPAWENATEYVFVNKTTAYLYTTPPDDKMNNFTWTNSSVGIQYWEDVSSVVSMNNSTIIIQHNPEIDDTMSVQSMFGTTVYTVVNVTSDKINCSYQNPYTGNTSYSLFDRRDTIERNESQSLIVDYPSEALQYTISQLLQYGVGVDYSFSLSPLAGESLKYTVTVEEIYKTSSD